ncbi:P-loop containing nucleoside triphosphate hydrolase protein [Mycena latifolia]|nr:P-loop containing nucleoside triphosphate hydrolase protein [Mycena latifolia]
MPSRTDHVKRTAESQQILQAAREKARRKTGYDSAKTRRDLACLFEAQFKKPPHEWQIDVSEALVLGLDAVVIAGTGAGKTIPFMMPLLLHREKFVLVISPLKILQADQAKRFKKMGLKAAAVNGDTYSRELQQDLRTQTHNAILTSPEMCFEHQDFRKWLRDEQTGKRILAVIVDEAHCASQWGGDFRPHYSLLHRLRSLLPVGTPILATSATLSPDALTEVCSGLDLDLDRSFFLNMGNDRPNITPSVVQMNGGKDYNAIYPLLPDPAKVHSADDLPKSIIFTNSVKKTQVICRHIRHRYPNLRGAIDFLHAHRTAKAKRRVMKQFRKGKIKILIATEAVGMGADIPDIELIIQFGVPSSLSVWIQRAGRAGRSPEIHARAILLVEKSMFQRRKKRKRGAGKDKTPAPHEPESSDSDSSSESGAEDLPPEPVSTADDGLEWGKQVDPVMREYISTATGECCDNCTIIEQQKQCPPPPPPQTPEPPDSQPSSAHSTPSKKRNANGKRVMVAGEGPKNRRKEHLNDSAFTYEALLPDKFLTSLASHRTATLRDLAALVPAWAFVDDHGLDVMEVLARVDDAQRAERERQKEAKKTARHEQTLARRAQRDLLAASTPKPPPKRRGRPPKPRAPLATTSANTTSIRHPTPGRFRTPLRRKLQLITPIPDMFYRSRRHRLRTRSLTIIYISKHLRLLALHYIHMFRRYHLSN